MLRDFRSNHRIQSTMGISQTEFFSISKNMAVLLLPGAEQEEDPEGDGARLDDPAGRVHAGPGAPAAADAAEAAHRAHAAAASDGAGEPGGVQQPAAEGAAQETHSGAAAAAQKPQGSHCFLSDTVWLFAATDKLLQVRALNDVS